MHAKPSINANKSMASANQNTSTRVSESGNIGILEKLRNLILGTHKIRQIPIEIAHSVPEKPGERRVVFGNNVFTVTRR